MKEKAEIKKTVKKNVPAKEGFSSSVSVFDAKGKEVEKFDLDRNLFTGAVNKAVLYQALVMYNANKRQGNASTKTRGDVSGGGKKPWRQKGTGRARAGSTRSPLWRHGGIIFGPHPRDYRYDLPKKIRRLALLSSLNSKLVDHKIKGIVEVKVDDGKTKSFKALLKALKLSGKSLFIVDSVSADVMRSSNNLREVSIKNYKDFNTMDVLNSDNVIFSKPVLAKLSERVS